MEQPRFTLTLMLRDNRGFDQPLMLSIGCDESMRISARAVSELKFGTELGIPVVAFPEAVEMMRTKEIRRDIFKRVANQLAEQMVDRMEDAEGWHDPSRVKLARESLGGKWSTY